MSIAQKAKRCKEGGIASRASVLNKFRSAARSLRKGKNETVCFNSDNMCSMECFNLCSTMYVGKNDEDRR